jgi:superfamily II DNA or RNA helicase
MGNFLLPPRVEQIETTVQINPGDNHHTVGAGFDWPELDTLFLAFPLAFKGRVVQYVGRLLRTHEDKHRVELHDYVDSRIPVLDRMHAKRLPAYATLGFDVPKTRKRRRALPEHAAGDEIDAF